MEDINWRRFGVHNGRSVYTVHSSEIRRWLITQPEGSWEQYIYNPLKYVFTEEFETMFLLKWS